MGGGFPASVAGHGSVLTYLHWKAPRALGLFAPRSVEPIVHFLAARSWNGIISYTRRVEMAADVEGRAKRMIGLVDG